MEGSNKPGSTAGGNSKESTPAVSRPGSVTGSTTSNRAPLVETEEPVVIIPLPEEFEAVRGEADAKILSDILYIGENCLLHLFHTRKNALTLLLTSAQKLTTKRSQKRKLQKLRAAARRAYTNSMKLLAAKDQENTTIRAWIEMEEQIVNVCLAVWHETVYSLVLFRAIPFQKEYEEELAKRRAHYSRLTLLIETLEIMELEEVKPFLYTKREEYEILGKEMPPSSDELTTSIPKGAVPKQTAKPTKRTSDAVAGMDRVLQGRRSQATDRLREGSISDEIGLTQPLLSSTVQKGNRHHQPQAHSAGQAAAGGGGGDPDDSEDDDPPEDDFDHRRSQRSGGGGRRPNKDDEEDSEPEYNRYGRKSLKAVYNQGLTGDPNDPHDSLVHLLAKHAVTASSKEKVPMFYGDKRKWEEWYTIFLAITHNDPKMPIIIKHKRLRECLGPEPLELVSSYDFNERNYDLVFGCLEQHYGDPERLLENLRHKILTFPSFGEGKTTQLLQFINLVQQAGQHLEKYQIGVYNNPQPWIKDIERKLPPRCLDRWYEMVDSTAFKLKKPLPPNRLFPELLAFLPEYYNRASRVVESRTSIMEKNAQESAKVRAAKRKGPTPTLKNFATQVKTRGRGVNKGRGGPMRRNPINNSNTAPQNSYALRTCLICGGTNHETPRCSNKADPNELFRLVLGVQACFNCLRSGHTVEDCEAKICDVSGCGKKHHRLLHGKTNFPRRRNDDGQKKKTSPPKTKSPMMKGGGRTRKPR